MTTPAQREAFHVWFEANQKDFGPHEYTRDDMFKAWQAALKQGDGRQHALHIAVGSIYFNDSSDYLGALWDVVRHLAPDLIDELERDPQAVWHRTEVITAPPIAAAQEGKQ